MITGLRGGGGLIIEPPGKLRSARRQAVVILVATLIAVVVLGAIGLGVEGHLQPTSLAIGGTSSARGEELARGHFGESSPFAVLLRGPAGAIERQGPQLAAALRREPGVTLISPWDHAAASRKLPAPAVGAPPGNDRRRCSCSTSTSRSPTR